MVMPLRKFFNVFKLPVAMKVMDFQATPVIYLYYLFNCHGNCHRFLFFISSAVQKCTDHDILMMNGISFMYMMSASSVTLPCHCIISVVSSCIVVTTRDDFFCTFLPCSDLIFTPKMSLVCSMSA